MRYSARASGVFVSETKVKFRGVYHGKIIRAGKVIDEFEEDNLVVNQGLDYVLSTALGAGSQLSTWYLGIFSGNYTPVSTDTASSIAGNSTESTAYTATTRPQWQNGAEGTQAISNSNGTVATFTFNGTTTIYGAFLVSSNTKSGTSGTLFSAAQFASSKSVVSSDQLLLTYSFTAASA